MTNISLTILITGKHYVSIGNLYTTSNVANRQRRDTEQEAQLSHSYVSHCTQQDHHIVIFHCYHVHMEIYQDKP